MKLKNLIIDLGSRKGDMRSTRVDIVLQYFIKVNSLGPINTFVGM